MVPSYRKKRERLSRKLMFPFSFGFTLVRAEKAVSSPDRAASRAERENGRGCVSSHVLVRNKKYCCCWVCSLSGLEMPF